MPKDNIDYSNTIIYKIYCNDETITDIYVGHTTNFYVRKYQHKNACKDTKNNYKIYKTIRENGGWDNWNMVEIAKYNCKDSTEARIKEQEHYEELKPLLNSCPPYVKSQHSCSTCNLQFNSFKKYNDHMNSIHIIETNDEENNFLLKNIDKHSCNICNYKTSKYTDYKKHLQTNKHINKENEINTKQLLDKNISCICGSIFNNRTTLWRHKQKCTYKEKKEDENMCDGLNIKNKDDLILHLFKQNSELQNKIIDLVSQISNKLETK